MLTLVPGILRANQEELQQCGTTLNSFIITSCQDISLGGVLDWYLEVRGLNPSKGRFIRK